MEAESRKLLLLAPILLWLCCFVGISGKFPPLFPANLDRQPVQKKLLRIK